MVNVNLGSLDGGLCDGVLVAMMEGEGFNVEMSVISTALVERTGQ